MLCLKAVVKVAAPKALEGKAVAEVHPVILDQEVIGLVELAAYLAVVEEMHRQKVNKED